MRIRPLYWLFLTLSVLSVLGTACRKVQTLSAGGTVKFSEDTLKFDTVFTSAGSFTNAVTIYNPQNEQITLSSVRMENGASSFFHINVDGFKGNNVSNITIAPHDSAYVFATVNIDPNDSLTPFLITDHLIATLNGKDFSIPVTAYGQNAHYIVSDSISNNTVWHTDLPYVVIHNCVVGPGVSLTIPANCRVYMHQDAQFIVYGNMVVNPTHSDSVVFQGDRLDRAYFGYVGYPGEWCGFWFVPGSTGTISHATLKNCGGYAAYYNYTAIPAAVRVDTAATLFLDHTIIQNSITLGILGFQGNVTASNCLVNTTGGQALAVSMGGNDSFVNCTFANYGTAQVNHANAGTVAILDWYSPDGKNYYYGNLQAVMRNCIVYGSLDSEIVCDTSYSPAGIRASLTIDHCLLKMGNVREPFVHFTNCLFNTDPKFKDSGKGDFHLSSGSPAIDGGTTVSLTDDLDGKPRVVGAAIDIGCYESQ